MPSEGSGRGFESRLVHHLLSLAQGNRFKNPFLNIFNQALACGFLVPVKRRLK